MKAFETLIISGLVMCLSVDASAGVFGVSQGDPITKYSPSDIRPIGGGVKVARIVVPTPNRNFDLYTAYYTPTIGICKLIAHGVTLENDKWGFQVTSEYKKIRDILVSKYGNGDEYDYLNEGALWSEPEEFAASLNKDERTLQTFWIKKDGAQLPEDIKAITVYAAALDFSDTYVVAGYEFSNFEKCLALIEKSDGSGM